MEVEDYIEHFGIKGMRWGFRRDRGPDGRVEGPVSADAERANTLKTLAKTSGPGALSNNELKDLNNRLNLEQNYSKLVTDPAAQSTVAKGASIVGTGFKGTMKIAKTAQEVYNVVNSPMVKTLRKMIEDDKPSGPVKTNRHDPVTRATINAMRPKGVGPNR